MRFLIIFLSFLIVNAALSATDVLPDRVLIKIDRTLLNQIKPSLFSKGQLGIAAIDSLNARYGVVKAERLFPFFKHRGTPQHPVTLDQWFRLYFSSDQDIPQVINAYRSLSEVLYVDPSVVVAIDKTPNDPNVSNQWHLEQNNDHDVDAYTAWDVDTGDTTIIVAVLDTGVRYFHQDLGGSLASFNNPGATRGNMWINWTEKNGLNGVDDDGNGKIDDWVGWDFVTGNVNLFNLGDDYDVEDNDPRDYDGHGTHCAGNVAAINNNNIGVCSVSGGWGENTSGRGNGALVMALRIGWYDWPYSRVNMDFAASAFTYAADNGAKIASCSWGNSRTQSLADAVNYFLFNTTDSLSPSSRVRLILNSAGNDNNTSASYLSSRPDVIAVAATDESDLKASFSNYGSWVDISAPGNNIYSTYHDFNNEQTDAYASISGTSMATPIAASVAALIWAHNPALSASQVEQILFNSADDIDALNPSYAGLLGAGRVNATTAVQQADQSLPVTLKSFAASILSSGKVRLTWHTESEIDNLGFNIYRSTNSNSPGTLIASYQENVALKGLGNSATGKTYQFTDEDVSPGETYFYWLEDVSLTGAKKRHGPLKVQLPLPNGLKLEANYPNPFNGQTRFAVLIPREATTQTYRVAIYNLRGQVIKILHEGSLSKGRHIFEWNGTATDGSPVASGVYLYGLEGKNKKLFRKLIYLK